VEPCRPQRQVSDLYCSAPNNKSLALIVSVTFTISRAEGIATSSRWTGQCARTVHYVGTEEALAVARMRTWLLHAQRPSASENGPTARS
jgi:hypothetical protein